MYEITDRGRMNVTAHPAGKYKPLLPHNPTLKDCRPTEKFQCFRAGIFLIILIMIIIEDLMFYIETNIKIQYKNRSTIYIFFT